MILVDTSVLVDKLRQVETEKTRILDEFRRMGKAFGISIYTLHEILQGAKSEKEFSTLREYFSAQVIFSLPASPSIYAQSAHMYYNLRRCGVTIRNTVDVLIAYTAIYHRLPLLHSDVDFDQIALHTPQLQIVD
jgi:predicted nucleic acid-binding protein